MVLKVHMHDNYSWSIFVSLNALPLICGKKQTEVYYYTVSLSLYSHPLFIFIFIKNLIVNSEIYLNEVDL